jgi:hypothetical protein
MRQITTNILKFNELSPEAKNEAIQQYCESQEHHFLIDDLTDTCIYLLEKNKCTHDNIKVLYSLSNSQGDGACFTGAISKGNKTLTIKHNSRYMHSQSTNLICINEEGEEIEEFKELKNIYFDICQELENLGYSIIEYVPTSLEEFEEIAQCDNLEFFEDGKIAR